MEKIKVRQMKNDRGNSIKNQFEIYTNGKIYFQSYNSIIALKEYINGIETITLDETYWNYSKTTAKYLRQFLGHGIEITRHNIDNCNYQLSNLN